MNKVIQDGWVAVLVSPGFGAGWSTWNGGGQCLFSPEIVEWVKAGKPGKCPEIFGEGFCYLGARDLAIEWVPQGQQFLVEEYDGSESLRCLVDIPFITA